MRNLIAAFLVAATLTGCNSEIDHAEVETKNGLIYKYGDTDPNGTYLTFFGCPFFLTSALAVVRVLVSSG